MDKNITLAGAILVCISIILGAMAAHGLESLISDQLITTFEKGVKYQMYAGIGLLAVGLSADKLAFKPNAFFALNLIGVFLFSGGIYAYTLHEMYEGLRTAALIVPFGGFAMILAWFIFIIQIVRRS